MIRRRELLTLGAGTAALWALGGRSARAGEPQEKRNPAGGLVARADAIMGTIVEVYVRHTDRRWAAVAASAALDACRRVDEDLSHYKDTSDLGRLAAAHGGWRDVTLAFGEVLDASDRMQKLSGGAFDPSAGAAIRLWKEGARMGREPGSRDIAASDTGRERIEFDRDNARARTDGSGVKLDFGGIAKGYAVDRAIETLRAHGIMSALVNAGGDLRVLGEPPVPAVGIQHPSDPDRLLARVRLRGLALATSGDYEQVLGSAGARRSHHFDPRTKEPVVNPPMSVSVIAPTAIEAQALACAAFVLGPVRGLELVRSFPGAEAWIVGRGEPLGRYRTPGFSGRIERPERA